MWRLCGWPLPAGHRLRRGWSALPATSSRRWWRNQRTRPWVARSAIRSTKRCRTRRARRGWAARTATRRWRRTIREACTGGRWRVGRRRRTAEYATGQRTRCSPRARQPTGGRFPRLAGYATARPPSSFWRACTAGTWNAAFWEHRSARTATGSISSLRAARKALVSAGGRYGRPAGAATGICGCPGDSGFPRTA